MTADRHDGAEVGRDDDGLTAAADLALPDSARARMRAGVSDNTRRGYAADWARFTAWCDREGRTPLPATGQTLAAYVDHLAERDLAPATIERHMYAIRRMHTAAGLTPPDTQYARGVLRAHRKHRAANGQGQQRRATPIVVDTLRSMVEACDTTRPIGVRDRALLVLGVAMLARRSELAALDVEDLRSVEEGWEITVRTSKTDQDAAGAVVPVLYGQHPHTCPVRTVRAWLDVLAERGVSSGPLFRPVDRHGRLASEPDAAGHHAGRLSPTSIDRIVRRTAARAGLRDAGGYSAHSLRAGGATIAHRGGAGVPAIAAQGRWNPNSPVILTYIRAADRWKDHPMRGAGL